MNRGVTLDEAAIALASRQRTSPLLFRLSARSACSYEDITKAPYTAIFNAGTTAKSLWQAVTVLRVVDTKLKSEQLERTGKEQLIAIHGNRFVLHLIFQKLLNEPVVNGVPVSDARIGQLTGEMLQATILNVLNHYPTAYPANLFKNASKCRDLSKRILEEPVPAAAV